MAKYYRTSSPFVGGDDCSLGVSVRILSVPTTDALIVGNGDGTLAGGGIGIQQLSTGQIRGYMATSIGLIYTPVFDISAGYVGSDLTISLSADSTADVFCMYVSGAPAAVATAYTGTYVAPTTEGFSVGDYFTETANKATSFRIWATAASDAAQSEPQLVTWSNDSESSNDLVADFPAGTTDKFVGRKIYQAPALWPSESGGTSLSRVDGTGNLTVASDDTVSFLAFQAPSITSSPVLYTNPSAAYSYTPAADGAPAATWTLQAGPVGMMVNSTTGEVTWTVDGTPGSDTVTIRATNTFGFDEQSYTLEWQAAPSITSTGSTTAQDTVAYSYDGDDTAAATGSGTQVWTVEDADGTSFAINSASGLVTWTPITADVGAKSIVIRVTTEYGFDEETINITVDALSSFTYTGVEAVSGTNYTLRSNTGTTALLGSGTMTFGVTFHLASGLSNGIRFIGGMGSSSQNEGYGIYIDVTSDGAAATLYAKAGDGSVSQSTSFAITDFDKHHSALLTISGGTLSLYVGGNFKSSTSVTYQSMTSSSHQRVSLCGSRSAGTGCLELPVFGGVFLDGTAESAVDISTWHSNCVSAVSGMADLESGASHMWEADDVTDCSSSWPASIGSVSLSNAGGSTCQETAIDAEWY